MEFTRQQTPPVDAYQKAVSRSYEEGGRGREVGVQPIHSLESRKFFSFIFKDGLKGFRGGGGGVVIKIDKQKEVMHRLAYVTFLIVFKI